MSSPTIRPATIKDTDSLVGLLATGSQHGLRAMAPEPAWVRRYLEANPGSTQVAECGGTLIAALIGGCSGLRGVIHSIVKLGTAADEVIERLVGGYLPTLNRFGVQRALCACEAASPFRKPMERASLVLQENERFARRTFKDVSATPEGMKDVVIERMTPEDIPGMLRLWNAIGAKGGVHIVDFEKRALPAFVVANRDICFVAKKGGVLIGVCCCGSMGRIAMIHHLAVVKVHRDCGVGTELVEATCAAFETIGGEEIEIALVIDDSGREKFWTDCGFVVDQKLDLLQCG